MTESTYECTPRHPIITPAPADRHPHAKRNHASPQSSTEVLQHIRNYILTADRVMLDRNSKTAIAEGRVQLKDAKGTLTRADRMEMLDDMRDALLRYLGPVLEHKSRCTKQLAK